jgi:uncharacterized protein with NAD-binding domain and iron-sulfur cluster
MRSEGRQKVVIIGGGPAGLAAAFELTKPGLCPGDCVTVYQMGWRLGGKCASGRDDRGRIVEHGLHLWFGYYENAFRLLREVYEELPDKPRRFRRWSDAFQPVKSTQIGDQGRRKDDDLFPSSGQADRAVRGTGIDHNSGTALSASSRSCRRFTTHSLTRIRASTDRSPFIRSKPRRSTPCS